MEFYIIYEIVALLMLLGTFLFFTYKNWLDLWRNHVYTTLMLLTGIGIFLNIILGIVSDYVKDMGDRLRVLNGIQENIFLMGVFYTILVYELAVVKGMRLMRSPLMHFTCFLTIASCVFTGASAVFDLPIFAISNGMIIYHSGVWVQLTVMFLILFAATCILIKRRKMISQREFGILLFSNAFLAFSICTQFLFERQRFSVFYVVVYSIVMYYLLLHNADQYRMSQSGCFSRAGFVAVVKEKDYYKRNFSCLSFCIGNAESLRNSCTREEIAMLHKKIGSILRSVCGRHMVYQVYTYEYVMIFRNREQLERKFEELCQRFPEHFRINNKNLSVLGVYYAVDFKDAEYSFKKFNRILSSMKKKALDGTQSNALLTYDGERQQEVIYELEVIRKVSDAIANRHVDISFCTIRSSHDSVVYSVEALATGRLDSGELISQEDLWQFAKEAGYLREFGMLYCQTVCQNVTESKILEKDEVDCLHINFSSQQVETNTAAESIIAILKKYHILGNQVCLEITVDQNVDYVQLQESMEIFHDYGVSLLLDQFGSTVCSLKQVMNLPFDRVKISHYLVRSFCEGKHHQLNYLVNMFRGCNWKVVVDGIDTDKQLQYLDNLDIDYFQGDLSKKVTL